MTKSLIVTARGALFATLLLAQAGCSTTSLINWNRDAIPEADARNPVRKVVCIWEPVQGQGLDGLPSRGFAGQIMFFTNGSPSPATSEGDVRVYLFHDRGTPEQRAKPIHQFDFKGEAWSQHLTKSVPGPSYRIFIPYVDKQPWQVNCGVRVRLTPPHGPPVFSEMVHVRLPGPEEEDPDAGVISRPESTPTSRDDARGAPEIQLGAVLEHHRGVAPHAAKAVPASKPLTPFERARQVLAEELQKQNSAADDHNQKPISPAAKSSGLDVAAAVDNAGITNNPDESLTSHVRPSRQLVRGNEPRKPSRQRRFRLSPADSNKTHLLNETGGTTPAEDDTQPHPLGETTPRPHPLEDE